MMQKMLLGIRSVSVNAIAYLLVYGLLGIGLLASKLRNSKRSFKRMMS